MLITVIFTFLLSWGAILAFYLFDLTVASPMFLLLAPVFMWIPGAITLLAMKFQKVRVPIFRKINGYYFLAPFLVLAVTALSIISNIPLGGYRGFEHLRAFLPPFLATLKNTTFNVALFGFISLEGIIAGLTINLLFGLGMEILWRGYLFEKLQHQSFIKRSFITGGLSGLWMAPFVCLGLNYPGTPLLGIILMVMFCISIAPIAEYFRVKSRSLLGSSSFIGSINALAGLSILVFHNPNHLVMGITGLTGILLFSLVSFGFIATEKKWREDPIQDLMLDTLVQSNSSLLSDENESDEVQT